MLVASHVTECQPGNVPAGHPLKVARAASPIENCDLVPARTNKVNGPLSHHQTIFIGTRPDKDVITWSGVAQRVTWKLKTRGVSGVDDERLPAQGICRWFCMKEMRRTHSRST
jgi:hypothetical protein